MYCCVPDCTKKGYREEDGSKVSHIQFPSENTLKKKWIHAIRREEGKDLKISESTKVCSRHFRKEDLKKNRAKNLSRCTINIFLDSLVASQEKSTCAVFTCANQWHQLPLLLAHADRMLLLRVSPSLKWKVLLRLAAMLKWRL